MSEQFLVADVGGTNCRLAMVEMHGQASRIVDLQVFQTADYTSFADAVSEFIAARRRTISRIDGCCVSVAGPVVGNVAQMTNAPWTIDAMEIESALEVPTAVINDFSALSYGLPNLDLYDGSDVTALRHVDGCKPEPQGAVRAVVGAGTGLGVGFLVETRDGYFGLPSEAGHSGFAPFDERSRGLRDEIAAKIGTVPGTEAFVSGQGITNWFDRLFAEFGKPAACDDISSLEPDKRPAAVAARSATDEICSIVMDEFFRGYGHFASDVALHFIPRAGLFVAGGIAAKNRELFLNSAFMEAFDTNYRTNVREVLRSIPVYLIEQKHTALHGAALFISQQRQRRLQ